MAIVDVVKFNGKPNIFAWKYPSSELSTWTQLIVSETQEAILFKGGQALDIYTAGRHTLDTANIPLLNKIINLPFGGNSPFTAEVWFVNKIHALDIKWGTPSPIQLQDPKYKLFISVRSFGQFGIRISDSRKFLMKLVGTLPFFDRDNITSYFKGLYLTKVKDSISSYLTKRQVSILEINAHLEDLSTYLQERMDAVFEDYGIRLVNFYVNDINIPENDPSVKKLKDALAKRAEMEIVGYNYVQERSFDTLEGAATNTGAGQAGLMGAGLGLGMGVGVGGNIGQQMGGLTQNINTKPTKPCPKCGKEVDIEKRFCGYCGASMIPADSSTAEKEAKEKQNIVKCINCGAEFTKESKFCPECGDPYIPCVFCGADLHPNAKVCPACGKQIPSSCPKCGTLLINPDAKYCPNCGESLVKKCPSCGAVVDDVAKFCPNCGNKL